MASEGRTDDRTERSSNKEGEGEEAPEEIGAEEGEGAEDERQLPPNRLLVLASRPRQNDELLKEEGFAVELDERTGLVTLVHPKRFSKTEAWFQRRLKGPEVLRRPLDIYGSRLYELCDGERTTAEVVEAMEEEFHEAIHPAASRVQKLLELFLRMGFVELLPPEEGLMEKLSKEMDEETQGQSRNDQTFETIEPTTKSSEMTSENNVPTAEGD